MAFNIKKAKVQGKQKRDFLKDKKERTPRVADKQYVIYIVETINLYTGHLDPYMVAVWSVVDKRYVLTVYTSKPDKATASALKTYKIKNTTLIDLRGKTKEEVRQFYRLR